MLIIELKGLQFYAYHGIYEAEKKTGGNFEADIIIKHQPAAIPILHLHETIDYTEIYSLVQMAVQQPTPLLETLVTNIASSILTTFSLAEEVSVTIKKLQPPIIGFTGEVAISFTMNRSMLK